MRKKPKETKMFFSKFLNKNKSVVGIDLGTSNIKIAQVTWKESPILETYGLVNCPYLMGGKQDLVALRKVSDTLKKLMEKAGVSTNVCMLSYPGSAVFTSVLEMPKMADSELATAVEFEAKKYIPLPLSEVDLVWTVLSVDPLGHGGQKILLTAVPKQITQNYLSLLDLTNLKAQAAEIEALSLMRVLVGGENLNCVIIDIGAKASSLNIVEHGFLRLSRGLNVGGDTITGKIAESLGVSFVRAEQFKKDFGVSNSTFIPEAIKPVLSSIKNEVKQLLAIYQSQNVKVDKLILVGGGALLPGIVGFFEDLKIKVELGNPLARVGYNTEIKELLKRNVLNLSVAIGLALRKA